jgi:hypothetical protein
VLKTGGLGGARFLVEGVQTGSIPMLGVMLAKGEEVALAGGFLTVPRRSGPSASQW